MAITPNGRKAISRFERKSPPKISALTVAAVSEWQNGHANAASGYDAADAQMK